MAEKIKWTGKISKNMLIVKDYLKEANLNVTKQKIGLNTDLTKGQVDRACTKLRKLKLIDMFRSYTGRAYKTYWGIRH